MKYLRYILLLLSCVLTLSLTFGQEGDTTVLVLDEINVRNSRLDKFAIGEKIESISSLRLQEVEYSNFSEVLSKYSGANIRSYGISGLSTISVRGTGSNHTAVFWEGVNLQSPTNGSLDLTLMPVSFVDDVSLQYGGAGSLFGSGTLGGAVHLTTKSDMPEGFGGKLFQQVGSFGSTYTGANINLKSGRFRATLRGFTNKADNDFNYYNRFSARTEVQENASIDQQGVLSETYFQPNNTNEISLKYWYQDNLVHVPNPASAGGDAKATQADEFHRAVFHWKNYTDKRQIQAQSALLVHDLEYDDNIREPSNTQSISWISEVEGTFKLKRNIWLDAGINNTYDQAEVDSYGGEIPSRNLMGVYLSSKMLVTDRLEVSLGVRETYNTGNLSPIMPSLGLNYAITNDMSLKSKVARSYRIPTFNDLYWKGGGAVGNPDLQPELGWSAEAGFLAEKQYERSAFSAEVTAFSNTISQWIQWVEVASIWSPVNVQEIWARGVELNAMYRYRISDNWRVQLWGNYNYTKSTKQEISENGNQQELHKQVIYTPMHQSKASIDLMHKAVGLSISQVFVGEQFVTGDNVRALDPYMISDVSLSYKIIVSEKHTFRVVGQVKNALDKNYEIRNARPMPGRNYHLSIIYELN